MKMKLLLLLLISWNLYGSDGNSGDVLTTDGAGTFTWEPVPVFIPGNETFYWIGPTASVSNNVDIPFFTTTPTRSNANLGDSADIILRISDTQMEIVNTGLHNMTFSWESSGSSDDFEIKINGDIWSINHVGEMTTSLNYYFTAGDDVTVTRMGGGSRFMSDITVSVTRMSE